MNGRSRRFFASVDKKAMWEDMRPFCEIQLFGSLDLKKTGCRNDFRRHISISRIFHVVRRTLCYVCGRKNQISELGLKSIHEVPNNEEPVCIVQEVGYILPFKDKKQ